VGVVKVLQSKLVQAETLVDTRFARQYPIYYTVGDRIHYSDVAAYQDFSKNLNDEIYFHFDSPMFNEERWDVEPPKSIEYYRQQVCEYIEDTYSNITVGYSGGTDSETVLNCFKRRGTKNIHFLHTAMDGLIDLPSKQMEINHIKDNVRLKHNDTIANLNWKFTIAKPWTSGSLLDHEKKLADFSVGSFELDLKAAAAWGKNSGDKVVTRANKKSVLIMGKEKPEIVIHNGWWCFHLINTHFEAPLGAADPLSDIVCFFTNDAVPELQKKLAWVKAQEMEKIFLQYNLQPTREQSMQISSPGSKFYVRLIDKMQYRAISDFLQNGSNKFGGEFWKKIQQDSKLNKNENLKNQANEKYFDEILIDTIDNRFLKMDKKSLHGICSKPIPLFPVDKTLYQSI
jgi:hypothetical protein